VLQRAGALDHLRPARPIQPANEHHFGLDLVPQVVAELVEPVLDRREEVGRGAEVGHRARCPGCDERDTGPGRDVR
jgi:hypothetical protein